jgi:hypothetical protein
MRAASDARATASAVACGRVGYVASFDVRLDAPRALEPRARWLDAPTPALRARAPTARCLRPTTRETLGATSRDDEDESNECHPRGNALAVCEDASTRDRETGTLWAASADGDGGAAVARARRDGGDGGLRVTAESRVRFVSPVVAVDVADGGYRGGRAMAGVCARTRRGDVALLRARETTNDAGDASVEVTEVARATRDGHGARDGVVCARMHPSWTNECAYVRANGTLGTLGGDGGKDASERAREERRGASDWYGVAYGAHPRTLVYADRSTVEFVDVRTRRGESRVAHDAYEDEAFRAVSDAREHYYALASARTTTTTTTTTTSFVEIRDARRARDPVVRWEHQGVRTPTTLRVVDTTEWRARRDGVGALTICAFTPGDSEVFLYDCARYANERRGHSGEQMCATSYGASVRLPTSSGVRGFDAARLGETSGGLYWLDDAGAWEQTYVIDAAESTNADATRITALRFENPRAPPTESSRDDAFADIARRRALAEEVARDGGDARDRPESAFADVPHLYEYIVHGKVPRANVQIEEREGDGGDEAATLHAAFSDGWRMNASELLDCGEYLQRDGASSASLAIDDWRKSRWQPDSSKPYKKPSKLRANREIENPLASTREDVNARGRWRVAVAAEDVLPTVADALKDYASSVETGDTKFTRRLLHASKCLEFASAEADAVGSPCDVDGDSRDVDPASQSQSLPQYDSLSQSFAMSQAVSHGVDHDGPFGDRLLARWVTETKRRRRESDDFASMPPPRPRFR